MNVNLSPVHEKLVAVLVVKEFIKRRPLCQEVFQTPAVTDDNQVMWVFLPETFKRFQLHGRPGLSTHKIIST